MSLPTNAAFNITVRISEKMQFTVKNILTPPCLRIEVGSSNKSSLMQALHFCGPELEMKKILTLM